MRPLLIDFRATRPRYEVTQSNSLLWLTAAHVQAEAAREWLTDDGREAFATRIASTIKRCACSPEKIGKRGASVGDIENTRWDEHVLYDLREHPHGQGSLVRTKLYAEEVDGYFAAAYEDEREGPDDLIHVTCTGYVSPSGAQQLVARKRWDTRVTHAYHMGCYASVPAVRMAAGFVACASRRVDLVHTELCSLHLDPTDHRIEQLVVQSLFADGMIRYSMIPDDGSPGLRLLAVHERVLPDSSGSMGWRVSDHGMQMTLARDVPERIALSIREFVAELFGRARLDGSDARGAVFAVHPGGPRIIDRVREMLELDDTQVRASTEVLYAYGNMSSATLPHIWQRVLDDDTVPSGTLIPSLAFGPGLTVCGALFEKR